MPDDEIRLTLPADEDLVAVVIALVGALARRAGWDADRTTRLRDEARRAFGQVMERGHGDRIDCIAWARSREVFFELRREGWTETNKNRSG